MSNPCAITALSYHLPEKRLTNHDLTSIYEGWTAEKIQGKTGIKERRISGENEFASDLAVAAAQRLFTAGYCSRGLIEAVILVTQSPDYLLPTTACLLQDRLGLNTDVAAFDINLGCSGFIYGLSVAKGLIASGQVNNVLLLTADTYSKYIHPHDKSVRTLFGDGAAAAYLSNSHAALDQSAAMADANGLAVGCHLEMDGNIVFGTDGRGGKNLIVPTGGMRQSYDPAAKVMVDMAGNERSVNNLFMNGAEIFNFTLETIGPAVQRLLKISELSLDDIDLFVFHQANQYMMEHLRKKLKLPEERFVIYLESCGNTVSSTIPIALSESIALGRIKPNARVMLLGFGVGYSWAGTIVRANPAV